MRHKANVPTEEKQEGGLTRSDISWWTMGPPTAFFFGGIFLRWKKKKNVTYKDEAEKRKF